MYLTIKNEWSTKEIGNYYLIPSTAYLYIGVIYFIKINLNKL